MPLYQPAVLPCLVAFVHSFLLAWNAFAPFLLWDNAYLFLKSLLNFYLSQKPSLTP